MNPVMKAHLAFASHIQKALGVKGGPPIQIFKKKYTEMVAKKFANITDKLEQLKKAETLFDEEVAKDKAGVKKQFEKVLETAQKARAAKKGSKKASSKKASKKASK